MEPARWPDAYARTVTLAESPSAPAAAIPVMRVSTAAFAEMIQGSGHVAEEILAAGAASRPLPSFEVPARLRAAFRLSRRDYTSDNVLALLPGTDPEVGKEIGFVFGYDPGTEDERRYRDWYQVRYHRPQDDLTQPVDFKAAAAFNRFFYRFAQTVSDAAERPAFTRGTVPPSF
jgi:hypothetical protein